jgi:cytidylate kinase
MERRRLIVAIDGPAGAGKSTIAQRVAQALGYTKLDTGAMYRALGLKAQEKGVSLEDEGALMELASRSRIELEPTTGGGNRVLLDGCDVSLRIRQPGISDAASRVSVHPRVRVWMVERQQEMGRGGGVVMEGRDIGTKVFPHAEIKVFLEASPEVRARRRLLQDDGSLEDGAKLKAYAEEIRQRDQRDRTRAASPLVAAPDAVLLDSSDLDIDQVVERVLELVRAKQRDLSTPAKME